MVVNKQVNFIKCLSVLLMNVSSGIAEKFTKFYTKRVFDTDLAPSKTFAYDFKLGPAGSSSHRRSLDKVKGLFNKYLAKVNPAIQLACTDFLPMGASTGFASINLFNLYFGNALPELDAKKVEIHRTRMGLGRDFAPTKLTVRTNHVHEEIFFRSVSELQSLHRYVRYLNYLARKHDVPVHIVLEKEYTWEGDTAEASGRAMIKVQAHFQGWYCNNQSDAERYARVRSGGAADDSLFADTTAWSLQDLDMHGKGHGGYKFHIAKFFLHLDKITNVLNTLTRKVEYGYSAFTFRT